MCIFAPIDFVNVLLSIWYYMVILLESRSFFSVCVRFLYDRWFSFVVVVGRVRCTLIEKLYMDVLHDCRTHGIEMKGKAIKTFELNGLD